jgi:large subunit ribosomal protein L36
VLQSCHLAASLKLRPVTGTNAIRQTPPHKGTNAMKVKASIKKRSEDCIVIRRKGKLFVINKKNPRFKQRQG